MVQMVGVTDVLRGRGPIRAIAILASIVAVARFVLDVVGPGRSHHEDQHFAPRCRRAARHGGLPAVVVGVQLQELINPGLGGWR